MRVYLAGPDVFLPRPLARAAALKAVCARHGLIGVSPLDPLAAEPASWRDVAEWRRIHLRNEAHIAGCAALIANLTPFRGPSADPGTVFEIGLIRGLGRPVFGYSTSALGLTERTLAALGGAATQAGGERRDQDGMLVEDFGRVDNLMIDGGILASGGGLTTGAVPEGERWTDLTVFERCVAEAARFLAGASVGSFNSEALA